MKKTIAACLFSWICSIFFGCNGYVWVGPRMLEEDDDMESSTAYVCLSIPDEEIPEAVEAVQMWDTALRRWRRFVAIKTNKDQGCSYWVTEVYEGKEEDPNAIAWVSKVGGRTIFLLKGGYEHSTKQVLLHELGHALGAQHVKGTLMHPTIGRNMLLCPDIVTVAQVAAWNNVDLTMLEWCEKK